MQKLYVLFALLLLPTTYYAQRPEKPTAVEIYNKIQKLNFLGSVLYIAAHPDDENTRLISYMANGVKARTGYLSLTRGDGGQNLVGPELRELLGVIRTQELIEARKIDGGEQFFSRANDFGYSKTPNETLNIWNKEDVLADMVYIIRKFKPDVIINRFDARTPGTTHGHHTASAMLSLEAFDKTANPTFLPSQLQQTSVWQPKRVFYNTSWWAYGKEKFDKMDKTHLYALNMGVYYPMSGTSNQEIAALSRSSHKSQGFGSTGTRGDELEYLELIKGDAPANKSNIFEGIDTSWNRVKAGKPIGELISQIEKNYDFRNPSASLPDLFKAYAMIQNVDDSHWKAIKSAEIKDIIAGCAGLYLEAVASSQQSTPGSSINLKAEAINRSHMALKLQSVRSFPEAAIPFTSGVLAQNIPQFVSFEMKMPENTSYTQPYWLAEAGTTGMYRVDDQKKIGLPDVIRETKVIFDISYNNIVIPFERTVIYKYNDDAQGEVYEPFDVVPEATASITSKVVIFPDPKRKSISVNVRAGRANVNGSVQLRIGAGWSVTPASIPFAIAAKGGEQTLIFDVSPPEGASELNAKAVVMVNGKEFDKEQVDISYPHISKQIVLRQSEAKLIKLDIKTGAERIAYVMGAGDEVPKSLHQLGYDVTIVKPETLSDETLADYDVVITGIRAYNTVKELSHKQKILFDFVRNGKTMIVQYNTLDDFVTDAIAPFPLKISRERVTEEDAEVQFIDPSHPILNYPNKITSSDFKGWKQEQGLYYPSEWDAAFTPILTSNDKGETPKKGALLVASYGKGKYIYTGLSFFRELPEGVPGAFRLMANLISQQKLQK
ncbi:MAG TPA: PIG-L family deacetylase [Flavobacterium sp.]|jgi:LmbE family N-acetylglucosaminyl deacetylase